MSANRARRRERHGLIWERVAWGTFFFLLAIVFDTELDVQFTLPKLVVLRIALPVLVGLWMVRLHRREVAPLPRLVSVSLIGLTVWWIIATRNAVHLPTALDGAHGRFNGLWTQLTCASLFVLAASSLFAIEDVEWLLRLFVAALVPVAAYALVQFAGWDPIQWPAGRSASTIGNPVILAAMLAQAMPIVLVFAALAKGAFGRLAYGAMLVLFVLAAMTTFSRGPLIAATASLIVVACAILRDRPARARVQRLAVTAVLVISVPLLLVGYREIARVRQSSFAAEQGDESVRVRMETIRAAFRIVRDHPIAGVGLENFVHIYPQFRSPESERLTPDVLPTMVHSGYLQAAATTGIPGLLLYAAFIGSVLTLVTRLALHASDRRERLLAVAIGASLCAYLIQDVFGWAEVSLVAGFWIILGLGIALARSATATRTAQRRTTSIAIMITASLWLVAAATLAIPALSMLRADAAIYTARHLDLVRDWASVRAAIDVATQNDDAVYCDNGGTRFAERFAMTGEPALYHASVALFERARARNPFNPYFQIHRLALETTAVYKGTVVDASAVEGVASGLVALDPNNATVYETLARLRSAERKFDEGLRLVVRAEMLRPATGRYQILEGDIRRSLGDRPAAAQAYRDGRTRLTMGDAEWIAASHRLIVTLAELQQYETAAAEARALIAVAPSNALAYTLLGIAEQELGRFAAARSAYRSALVIDPNDKSARAGLAQIEKREGMAR